MKRSTKLKLSSLLCLGLVLIGYNQCINPMATSTKSPIKFGSSSSASTSPANGMSSEQVRAASIGIFQTTVYPITRARCVSCHGDSQSPLHASSNPTTAHNALVDTFKVDFNNIPNSRMVLKLRTDRHNCWGDCSANAMEMENQITEWKRQLDAVAPASTEATTNVKGKITTETKTVQELLSPENLVDNGTITLMAESGSLKTPMVKAAENGTGYIWAPEGTGLKALTSVDAGLAFVPFRVTTSNFYYVWMLVSAADANSDSVFVKVAGSDTKEWHLRTVTTGFQWRKVEHTTQFLDSPFYVTGGQNVGVDIRQRDDGFKISKIILTNNAAFNPATISTTALKATVSLPINTLSGVAGSTFEIDVEEYDMYSYKFSNPRIKTTQDIFVKNLKILVNGSYNPQNATYTIVDKKVTATDSVLSTFSMIALKDKGLDQDRLSFGFEHIAATAAPVTPVIPPTPTTPPGTPPVVKLTSQQSLQQTLWPILRANCAGCHAVTQPPLHSSQDINVAHTNLIETALVNFATPTQSKLTTKLKNGLHNCGGATACANLAAQMEAQITVWKALSGR